MRRVNKGNLCKVLDDGLLVDLRDVSVHGDGRGELLLAVRAREVLGLLVLVQDDLIVEDLVAVVAEGLKI